MRKIVYFSWVKYMNYAALLLIVFVVGSACSNRKDNRFTLDTEREILQADSFRPAKWVDVGGLDTVGYVKISSGSFDISKLPPRISPFLEFRSFAKQPSVKTVNKKPVAFQPLLVSKDKMEKITPVRKAMPRASIDRISSPNILSGTTTAMLQLSEAEGLNGNLIYAAVQDKDGTKWFSTEKGLSRFDGETLLTYQILNATPQGSFYPTSHLNVDAKGRLWLISCQDGIYVIDIAADSLIHLPFKNCLSQIAFDQQGKAWVGNYLNGNLLAINTETLKSQEYTLDAPVFTLTLDRRNRLWIGGPKRVFVVDSARNNYTTFSDADGMKMEGVTGFAETMQGHMWMSSVNKVLYSFSSDLQTIESYDSSMTRMSAGINLLINKRGDVWALDNDTLMIIRPKENIYRKIYTGATLLRNFKAPALIDKYGVLWLGTINKGFVLLDTEGPMIEILDDKSGLSDNNVWGMAEDSVRKLVFVPTGKGMDILDRKQGKTFTYSPNDRLLKFNRRILQVDEDRFLLTNGYGVSMLNLATNKVTHFYLNKFFKNFFPLSACMLNEDKIIMNLDSGCLIVRVSDGFTTRLSKKQGLPSNLAWFLSVDSNKEFLWLGTDSGLVRIDSSLRKVKIFNKQNGLLSNNIQRVMQRENGEWVVAMQGGLSVISKDFQTVRNIAERNGLRHANVYDLLLYKDKIYAGTQDGLYVISLPDSGKGAFNLRRYAKRQGLPYNDYNQNAGMVTSYGQLWWGVTPNVTVVTQPLQLDTIPTEVRLNGLRILYQRLQFRNNNGQSRRNKGQAPDQTIPQGITWDSLSGSFNLPIGLRLPHNQNTVNIDFNTNDVRSRDQIVYTYMLEGEDSGWCRPTPIPESKTYFNLSAGKYSFRVKAKGANGIWGPVATISFEVLKPWWIQWWALILYLGALALFTWLVSNYRSRMLKKENSLLEKRVNERTVALENSIQELKTTQAQMIQREKMASLGELTAGIAHEIQNPLNFVNNFSEVNQELLIDLQTEIDKGNDKAVVELLQDLHSNNVKINQHGKRADSIIKSMLQHSRSSSGDKESTDLNALCDEYLQLSYHGMRAKEKDFNVKIHSTLAKDLPLVRMVPQDIGRVLMNLLNNAFYAARKSKKTGQPGFEPQVSLTTASQERMVTISIKDNGDGIPEDLMKKIFQPFFTTKPTGEGTGLGLSLSFDIITKGHGGQLQVQTEPGMGTTFIISLPKS